MAASGFAVLTLGRVERDVDVVHETPLVWALAEPWDGCADFEARVAKWNHQLCAAWGRRGPAERFSWTSSLSPLTWESAVSMPEGDWVLVDELSLQIGPYPASLEDLSALGSDGMGVAFAETVDAARARDVLARLAAGGVRRVVLAVSAAAGDPLSPPDPSLVVRLVGLARSVESLAPADQVRQLKVGGEVGYAVTLPAGRVMDRWSVSRRWAESHGGRCPNVAEGWPSQWTTNAECDPWMEEVSARVLSCGCTPDARAVLNELAVPLVPVQAVVGVVVELKTGHPPEDRGTWVSALEREVSRGTVWVPKRSP